MKYTAPLICDKCGKSFDRKSLHYTYGPEVLKKGDRETVFCATCGQDFVDAHETKEDFFRIIAKKLSGNS